MPPINHAAVSAGVIVVSVAVAAAIAVYESPELRRMADDVRRRIALALHSLGDGVDVHSREPRFNRPEDAEGFMQSQRGGEADVDADEETRRRQRDEIMYWNRLHLEKKEKEQQEQEQQEQEKEKASQSLSRQGSSFDDFLREDGSAEKGTFVFNTGADLGTSDEGLVRRRGAEGVRGLNSSMYANPFGDEHGIDIDEHPVMEATIISPGQDENMTEMYYNATPVVASRTLSPPPVPSPVGRVLFDADTDSQTDSQTRTRPDGTYLIERELSQDEYMTAGQDYSDEAYASIQAWAENSNPGFYSPLPVSPPAPLSEPEVISQGALTPTDSVSLVGSPEDVGTDAGSAYEVMSDDEDEAGQMTPSSWTEVGSVVSSDGGAVPA